MGYNNRRKLDGDFFHIQKEKSSVNELQFYIDRIDFPSYYIYKQSRTQFEVYYDDFINFKYSSFIFFRRDLFLNEEIDECIKMIYKKKISFNYLSKPLPHLSVIKKIIVIDGLKK